IGDVEYFPVPYPHGGRDRPRFAPDARRYLERPIESRKGDLLRIVQMLTGQHANRIRVHRLLDRPLDGFVDWLTQVDPGNPGDEERMKRCDDEAHGVRLPWLEVVERTIEIGQSYPKRRRSSGTNSTISPMNAAALINMLTQHCLNCVGVPEKFQPVWRALE